MIAIYRRHQTVPRIAALLVTLFILFLVVDKFNRYLQPHPKVKDAWRSVSANQENIIVVGWSDHYLRLNLATGELSYYITWSMDPEGDSFSTGSIDGSRGTPLSLEKRVAIKKWVKSLPPAEIKVPPDILELRIVVNLNGTQQVYQYTRPGMVTVMQSLSKIVGRDFLGGGP